MAGKEVTKVVKRCDDAKEDRKLDLSSCQLMQVPDAVFFLLKNTPVEACDLSFNVIRKIPSKLALKFTHLTDLKVCNNKLSTLPEELKDLSDLLTLDISYNKFTVLPKVVYKLEKLKDVNAESNAIEEVDVAKLQQMISLDDINLQHNPLPASTVEQLSNIRVFTVTLTETGDLFDGGD